MMLDFGEYDSRPCLVFANAGKIAQPAIVSTGKRQSRTKVESP
jgi:hypothetical protein